MNEIPDAQFELEHISGFAAALRRADDRLGEVRKKEPYERIASVRLLLEAAREEFANTVERIKRWGTAWDHAFDKLIRARLRIVRGDRG